MEHEAVSILNAWKEAVTLAVDALGRAKQKELADAFLDVRYRDGIRVFVTASDGKELEVLSLAENSGRLYVVPCNRVEAIFRDDANDPRVMVKP